MSNIKFLALFIGVLITLSIQAQNFNPKELTICKKEKRTFVFYKLEPKKRNKNSYNEKVAEYNNRLEEVLTNYWTIDAPYVLLPEKKALEYFKKNKKKTVLVECDILSILNGISSKNGLFEMVVYKVGRGNSLTEAAFLGVFTEHKTKAELVNGINTLQFFYKNTEKFDSKKFDKFVNYNTTSLKGKKLLILEESLNKKILSTFSEIYPYDYELASQAEIDKAILEMSNEHFIMKVDAKHLVIYNPANGTPTFIPRPYVPSLQPFKARTQDIKKFVEQLNAE